MADQEGSEKAEAERRQADRRRNASLDFGVADRRKADRRGERAARG